MKDRSNAKVASVGRRSSLRKPKASTGGAKALLCLGALIGLGLLAERAQKARLHKLLDAAMDDWTRLVPTSMLGVSFSKRVASAMLDEPLYIPSTITGAGVDNVNITTPFFSPTVVTTPEWNNGEWETL